MHEPTGERAPTGSWLDQLGPNVPGERDPETGEIPLYRQQMDHPQTEPGVHTGGVHTGGVHTGGAFMPPVDAEVPHHPIGPSPVPSQDPWSSQVPQVDLYQEGVPGEVALPQSAPYNSAIFDLPEARTASAWTDLMAPDLVERAPSPTGLAVQTAPAAPPFDDFENEFYGDVTGDDEGVVAEVPKMPYLAGLDGLRALTLGAVLAFSGGVSQIRGGFLGISTAFTLSGFLLTTLLLSEWSQRSSISLRDLWDRRAARLVPPTYAIIGLVIALQLTMRVGSVPTFRTDVWAGLGFATNWQLVFPAQGFASSFNELSALRHLWPVAVIVQLTVLLPLIFVGLMAVTSRNWRTAGTVFVALTAGSYAAAWILSANAEARDVVYYGTHTRAGEVLAGVALAYLILTPSFRSIIDRPAVLTVIRRAGPAAAAGLVALWVLLPIDSDVVFQGGTALNALLTAIVVLALTMPGPTSAVLSLPPLRRLGQVSFSAYLLHWPLFLLLDDKRTGLDGLPLFGARVGATIVAAMVVTWTIESTFRWRLVMHRTQLAASLGITAAIMAILVVILPINPPANISLTVNDGTGPGELDVVAPAGGDTEAARVLVIGDEAAASMVSGFELWNEANPDAQMRVDTHVAADCPLGGPGPLRRFDESVDPTLECEAWRYRLPNMLDAAEHDAIVVLMGAADLGERQIDGSWRHVGEVAFDRWMSDQISGLADVVEAQETPVVWLTTPHVRLVPEDRADGEEPVEWADFDDNDPQRVNRLNALIHAVAGGREGFDVVDLDGWLQNQPGGQFNPDMRTGSEFTEEGAGTAAAWVGLEVLAAAGVEPSGDESAEG